ncbi:MAG: ester cyclase [Cyanobacteria bacterium P01_A01_bin.83]
MHLDRIENGKIVEHWRQGDAQGLMQQLGIMFLPSSKLLLLMLKNSVSKLSK